MKLGVTLPQFTSDPYRFLGAAKRAEDCGLDSIWVFDHLWPLSGERERPILECWSALTSAALATERIGVGTLVLRASLRKPLVLAAMARSLAAIVPGRLTFGVGSGDALNRSENDAYDIPFYEGATRYEQLETTVQTLRAELGHADSGTSPLVLPAGPVVQSPSPVWVGGLGREVRSIAGRSADGWNCWGGDTKAFERRARIVEDAAGSRRVELTWAGTVVLGPDDESARAKANAPDDALVGGPETVARALNELLSAGATHLICSLLDAGVVGSYELLAERVRPLLGSS